MAILRRSCPLLLALILAWPAHAENVPMHIPPGNFTHKLGGAPLHDPSGVSHSRRDFAGKVAVVIFSVPDMSLGPSQKRWSAILADKPKTRLPDRVALLLVENMAQAGAFKEEARHRMKEQFAKKKRPFLLLDETGAAFARYGILRDKTEILIFDQDGTLRDVEEDLHDIDATVGRIKAITEQLEK